MHGLLLWLLLQSGQEDGLAFDSSVVREWVLSWQEHRANGVDFPRREICWIAAAWAGWSCFLCACSQTVLPYGWSAQHGKPAEKKMVKAESFWVIFFLISLVHIIIRYCHWWCRRSIKYTGGMGCLLLSPTSFWVGLTVILDCILRETSIKVPASMSGRRVWSRRGHYVSVICWVRAAQRLVCFETKSLFELLHSSQLASLPVGYSYDRCQVCQF